MIQDRVKVRLMMFNATFNNISNVVLAYIIQWFIFFSVLTAISFIIALFRAEEGSLVTGLIGEFW
jgi:pheromone shutdown protein TraB